MFSVMIQLAMSFSNAPATFRINVNPWPAHGEPSALLVAQAADGTKAGQVGLQIRQISRAGLPASEWPFVEGAVAERVLLSELWVHEAFRRQGLGRRLCLACEEVVRSEPWGFQELFLYVEERNLNARNLYLGIGYEYADPANAERLSSEPLKAGIMAGIIETFRKATADPICLRKDLV